MHTNFGIFVFSPQILAEKKVWKTFQSICCTFLEKLFFCFQVEIFISLKEKNSGNLKNHLLILLKFMSVHFPISSYFRGLC